MTAPNDTTPTTGPLTRAEMELLEFARATWKYRGRKETVVAERFGTTLVRHEQRLAALLARPEAAVYDAQLVSRLTRLTDRRRAARSNGFDAADGSNA